MNSKSIPFFLKQLHYLVTCLFPHLTSQLYCTTQETCFCAFLLCCLQSLSYTRCQPRCVHLFIFPPISLILFLFVCFKQIIIKLGITGYHVVSFNQKLDSIFCCKYIIYPLLIYYVGTMYQHQHSHIAYTCIICIRHIFRTYTWTHMESDGFVISSHRYYSKNYWKSLFGV